MKGSALMTPPASLDELPAANQLRAALTAANASREYYVKELLKFQDRLDAANARLAAANALLREWSVFDFECPDEFNDETEEEEADGWALDKLYDDTRAHLAGQPDTAPKTIEDCPACGPDPCTPACPEREWRYAHLRKARE